MRELIRCFLTPALLRCFHVLSLLMFQIHCPVMELHERLPTMLSINLRKQTLELEQQLLNIIDDTCRLVGCLEVVGF